ncbi:16S rRNA (guanine(966)-N(2))-methyltransferase RsmD [Luteolibacter pohnpeiensis]|uniref:16S rRNA (Guanine(966)-N(2))-methyltransferase RsmD n=1 Tax=Luteolibacter pohnpeiensis TaxID=454153 RepID=A0A934S6D2_9BACT|nr:16S rRNA (guanine(966)-N(2))-methyltransferase RsmD [Luteolibacter pohnpeiensis]MBK1882090.1 16S rRNA (guanine(966)-N(2))-methyltransferase RsmD [Luteolibacter pohnpeiensis]
MRIIAGKAGRTAIKVPGAVARPTTDFVRQAIFSILADSIDGAKVLDLFAGSGAIGLEALSRGAASCTFVDEHRQATAVISENLKKARLDNGNVVRAEVTSFLKRDTALYDLIFADPPYFKQYGDPDHVRTLLESEHLPQRLSDDGWLIAEISASQPTPTSPAWTLLDRREYGGCAILLFSKSASPST